jgi:hypothetical protein
VTNPITPPPELLQQWDTEGRHQDYCTVASHIAARAAQWGADQELEACCEWLSGCGIASPFSCEFYGRELRAARRPKPPSLKEQALERCNDYIDPDGIIRRALEALPDG